GLRAQADARNEKLGYKIRGAQLEKVPYMLILGDKEVEAQSISIRNRAGEETNDVALQDFIADLQKAVRERQG
ncbi:MAG: His/Gly/Thr/Pro-type tRNA ligase C-terminal domain-containing protein, partial [Negativicoccus succinicivorans]|nr:His/Gly/Thr/Pro-type tRNA ligase C-terminal domain-containing protein [Negativicoccus succinicivorans]